MAVLECGRPAPLLDRADRFVGESGIGHQLHPEIARLAIDSDGTNDDRIAFFASIGLEIRIMRSHALKHFRRHIEGIGFDADDRLHRFERRERPVLVADVGATSERQGEKTGDLREGRNPPSRGQNINFSLHVPIPCGQETLDTVRPRVQPERSSEERR